MRAKNSAKSVYVERRAVLLQERHHLARDVALVEAIARGDHAGLAALRLRRLLGLDHPLQRARERRQLDRFARLVLRAVGLQPVLLVVGPALEELQLALNRARRARRAAGTPSPRTRSPGVATCSKLIVPHFSSTVSAACSAPGTTAGSSPCAARFFLRDRYQSTVTALRRPSLADDRVTLPPLRG